LVEKHGRGARAEESTMRSSRRVGIGVIALLGLLTSAARAVGAEAGESGGGEAGGDAGDLAKAVQNPVADLISVPFQNNTSYNIGPFERAQNTLNIQPVVPLHLSEDLLLITRTILPIVYQPDVTAPGGGASGVGDLNPTFFLSPGKPGKLIYGVAPTFSIPTATQRATGFGKWCVGPAAVALVQPDPWTIGVLASQLWSFAGPSDRSSVSFLTIQYFVNYNLPHAWYLSSSPIITADFKTPEGDTWTVPFGGGLGKIFKVGKLPFNGTVQAYYNVRPNDADRVASWQLRIQLALLLPTAKAKHGNEQVAAMPSPAIVATLPR
jgi:hypothetical protein